ncbi:MAG: hypothetical protein ACOC80_14270 [Petrotogales bacterium]
MDIIVHKKIEKPVTNKFSSPNGADKVTVVWVSVHQGKTKIELGLSRYSTEADWYIDCQFTNRLPVFNHGEGDRCCLKQKAQNELLEAIENAPITAKI